MNTNRKRMPTLEHPVTVCFRITRKCNYTCEFCQAPFNGIEFTRQQIRDVLIELAARGTIEIKFTGGEPLASPNIQDAIATARNLGMNVTVITNGTLLVEEMLRFLSMHNCRIKVSLHGPVKIHSSYKGVPDYSEIESAILRCVKFGLDVSIHTLVTGNRPFDIDSWVEHVWKLGAHKISFLPFVARGRGLTRLDEFSLSSVEIGKLKSLIHDCAHRYRGRITVRYVDLIDQDYLVTETSGKVVIQRSVESLDEITSIL